MKIRLGGTASDVFVAIYLFVTLYLRFSFESQLQGYFVLSIALGGFALLFLWALVKVKILNPNWFGLLK